MKRKVKSKFNNTLFVSGMPLIIVMISLMTMIAVAMGAPGGIINSPTVAPGPALPAAPEAALGSLKNVPLWNELQQMLDDPNNLNPARRASFLPNPLPPLEVHPLDFNPLTGEPLTLDPDTGQLSYEVPAYGVSTVNGLGQLVDETGTPVTALPKPVNENDFILDRDAAAVVGKALFWDMQIGSDGVQACASCHFHAGADDRTKNSLSPGLNGGDLTLQVVGPNEELTADDFPFHKLDDIEAPGGPGELNPDNAFESANDVVSSMGVIFRQFVDVPVGPGAFFTDPGTGVASLLPDAGNLVPDPVPAFQGVRRVEPRNTPTTIGAVFNFDNFLDGRARAEFNGGSVSGASDPYKHVFANNGTPGGAMSPLEDPNNPGQPVRIALSSLASQATGPPLSGFEMSFDGRNWAKLGKRMLQSGVVPLANQLVATDDSVLGPYSSQGGSLCPPGSTAPGKPGLCVSYPDLLEAAFKPEYLANTGGHLSGAPDPADTFDGYSLTLAGGPADPNNTSQFTQMEANFSLFFGLGVQLYEQLLIPDDSPFDRFMEANPGAAGAAAAPGAPVPPQPAVTLVPGFDFEALVGLDMFQNSNLSGRNDRFRGDGCTACHAGPEFTTHSAAVAFGSMIGGLVPLDQDPNLPTPGIPAKSLSGYMLADAYNGPPEAAVEIENVNFAGAVLEPGFLNAFLDEGMYNIGVTPIAQDAGRGGTDPFGWPLTRATLALQNLGGNGGAACPDAANCSTQPGVPLANFDPDLGPAGLSVESRGGGLFGPTPAYQRWLDSGGLTGPLNPGLSPGPLNPLLPAYMAPWTANLSAGASHPQLGELLAAPNTLTAPPTAPFGVNQNCVFGVANTYPDPDGPGVGFDPPANFGPNCPNLVSGKPNDAVHALVGTWPDVNRVGSMGAVKVPTLRNIELTGPYFHNGATLTLQQVIDFYDRGGDFPKTNQEHLDPAMLTVGGSAEVVNFMLTLTDDRVKFERAPFDHPELFIPSDGAAPDNTGGRSLLLTDSTGPGAAFRQLPAVGEGGNIDPLTNFLGIASEPVPDPNNDQFDNAAPIRYLWNYYDSQAMSSWILIGNPPDALENLEFGLSIGNDPMGLANLGEGVGVVPPGQTLPFISPGLAAGPAIASSRTQMPAITSQRSLMGDSFEEVLGIDIEKQSRHFYWSWYDMQSPGFENWIIINNTFPDKQVAYEIKIGGASEEIGLIPAGGKIEATFPGQMGGPVEVITDRNVMATQRVLSNNGTAFNEVPGIPAAELSTSYIWTWYDMMSPGYNNWVLIANPDLNNAVDYEIRIAGATVETGTIPAGDIMTPSFPGTMDGPVELIATGTGGGSGTVIASQRVLTGKSFEEVPGYPQAGLTNKYYWTWYDMTSGFSNWVLISNSSPVTVDYEVKLDGSTIGTGSIPAGEMATPVFPGQMGGPVEVSASSPVMVSQRVTRNGHFNEVLGTTLTAAPAP